LTTSTGKDSRQEALAGRAQFTAVVAVLVTSVAVVEGEVISPAGVAVVAATMLMAICRSSVYLS
jgi:hypothetical protein